jgi:ribulose-phosphate 3-epimerase
MIKLIPSILSADILNLKEQIRIVEQNGANSIHVDVMDGVFVPNITFGPMIVAALKKITQLPLDVHLMIIHPDEYIDQFIDAGADIITIPQEAESNLNHCLTMVKNKGCEFGVSLNPATSVITIDSILKYLDRVLVMTVNPGFGGQKFMESTLEKIEQLVEIRRKKDINFLISVDGGINIDTAPLAVKSGADALVAGNSIFGQKNIAAACRKMKEIALLAKNGS